MDTLEDEALEVVKKYRMMILMSKPIRNLLLKVAERLGWERVKGEL